MADTFCMFGVLFKPNLSAENDIKLLFIFGKCEKNVIYVTKEDEVFTISSSEYGFLNFNEKECEPPNRLIKELCGKQICALSNGYEHLMILTAKNELYCWGFNRFGQLGNGTWKDESKPKLMDLTNIDKIIDICCGYFHSLALTQNGNVYSWGRNEMGQLGDGSSKNNVLVEKIMSSKYYDEIIAISCGKNHNLALNKLGKVYSWGDNSNGQLGIVSSNNFKGYIRYFNKPSLIKIDVSFKKICCGPDHNITLTTDGDIYTFGNNFNGQLGHGDEKQRNTPTKLNFFKQKCLDIAASLHCEFSVALTIEGTFFVWGICGDITVRLPKETQFNCFNKIFLNYSSLIKTYKPIHFEKITFFKDGKWEVQNGKYYEEFDEICRIAIGNYGIVCKAKNKKDNEIFAVKKIPLNTEIPERVSEEINMMIKLRSQFIVQCYSAWCEKNYLSEESLNNTSDSISTGHRIYDPKKPFLLHIKMELCFKTLTQLIEEIRSDPIVKELEIIINFYISSEILVEIFECVKFLHEHVPPIIHRDLKPSNILITDGLNGRFIKLADFGLACFHEEHEHKHTKGTGTREYMAPEVIRSTSYDTKADIFSLGIIIQDLFNFDINQPTQMNQDVKIGKKNFNIAEMAEKMMNPRKDNRPDCKTLLEKKESWALSIKDLKIDENVSRFINENSGVLYTLSDKFKLFFIRKKIEFS